jgi:hypothetical protein
LNQYTENFSVLTKKNCYKALSQKYGLDPASSHLQEHHPEEKLQILAVLQIPDLDFFLSRIRISVWNFWIQQQPKEVEKNKLVV